MSWSPVKLGSCIDFQNGYAFKSKFFVTDTTQYALIKGENLGKGFIHWNKTKYWQIEQISGLEKFFINANDILLAMDRPYVSGGLKYTMVKEDELPLLQVQRIGRLTAKKEKITPHFLKAVIGSPFFLHYIKNLQGGVGVPHISPKQIKSYEFLLPAKSIQKKIASILSTYDDLIENNLKRIKLLEEAAQNVYKEWFVHFRFPEHEKVKMDKEIGLPEGWERKEMHMIGDVVTGKTPSTKKKEYYGNDVPFIKTPDMHKAIFMQKVEQYLSHDGADSQRTKYLPMNTVIVACIGAKAGVVAITATKSQTNQQINAIKSFKDFTYIWLYYTCISLKKYLISLGSSGATMTNVSKGKFENIKVNYPPEDLLQEFQNVCKPIFNQILCLQKYNLELKEARDILLPRLMNQTIRV